MNKKNFIIIILICICAFFTGCTKEKTIREANPNNDVYYQIFVRSFADSDNDGIGDFNGITAKLDYLDDLGVSGLWLMPIHPSMTYHGYDVVDYYATNEEYGTMEDFKNLCKKAEEKGIKIMLDLVINHTSIENEWFQKALNDDPKYKDYYVFTTASTANIVGSWGQNIYHTRNGKKYCGYFDSSMPDLNYFNSEVQEEIFNVGRFWVEAGVDGFRIDAAQHLYGQNEYLGVKYNEVLYNVQYLELFEEEMKKIKSDFYITGEINLKTESIVKEYFAGIDSPLDFPIAERVMTTAASSASTSYVNNLIKIYNAYSSVNPDFISAPFLRNHDEDRVASELGNDIAKMKLAAEMLLTLPGSPIIYYGEEVGMFGTKSNGETSNGTAIWDETRRLPLNFGDSSTTTWFNDSSFLDVTRNAQVASVEAQLNDSNSILQTYKSIIKVRNENIALRYGNSVVAYENNTNKLQGFYREYTYLNQTQRVLVIHNLSLTATELPLFEGTVLYLSGQTPTMVTSLPAKSTIIIDVTEAK